MGAGRKTETINIDSRIPAFENSCISARNLHKNDLGGVIFGCKHSTMPECLSKQLFGLPSAYFSFVRNIDPGLPIFHFNYSDRKLHGIYESASYGKMYIDAYAWTVEGAERTPFPAQVRIRIRAHCQPLCEEDFKKIIEDNYYTKQHFWFELDHSQTCRLIALFKPHPPPVPILNPLSQSNHFPPLPASKWKAKKDSKAACSEHENKYAALSLDYGNTGCAGSSKAFFTGPEEICTKEPVSNWEELEESHADGTSSEIVINSIGAHGYLDEQPIDEEEYKNVLHILKRLSVNSKLNSFSEIGDSSKSSSVSEDSHNSNVQLLEDSCSLEEKDKGFIADNLYHGNVMSTKQPLDASVKEEPQIALNCSDETTYSNSGKVLSPSCSLVMHEKDQTSTNLSHGNAELLETIRELKARIVAMEKQQAKSDREILHLSDLQRNSGQKVQMLTARVNDLELKLGTSMLLDDGTNKFVEHYLGSEDVIYLLGGYNGSAWLSALDSFSPSLDILTPLKSMSYVRSYVSAVALDGVLYALGGVDGSSWYDAVECYDRRHDEWTSCPPMIHERGSLASATLDGKIYAIGGGNGLESFSDVEMFDPVLGRWIARQLMFHKRFAPTAAELNGSLYAVGGYDGHVYLKSAERLDPRECFWTTIPDMTTRRGCHSMAVLNEKLYVMGGYDGDNMVSSVEVYEPRANAWMPGEPMSSRRGYAASAVLGNSLFTIGGITESDNLIETIECYKEGIGWSSTLLKAVGKRCFFSVVVL